MLNVFNVLQNVFACHNDTKHHLYTSGPRLVPVIPRAQYILPSNTELSFFLRGFLIVILLSLLVGNQTLYN